MNEPETRVEYIDPKLKESGWGEVEGSRVLRGYRITEGKILTGAVTCPRTSYQRGNTVSSGLRDEVTWLAASNI